MFAEIENEFKPKFKGTDLDFQKEYNSALARITPNENEDVAIFTIRNILSGKLAEYANSKSTTWWGKAGRFFSGIGSVVIKYINIKNIFKKK